MKPSSMLYFIMLCTFQEKIAHDPPMDSPMELHPSTESCNKAECAAKTCATCCWITAWIPTASLCLLNDISCGSFCGKPAWSNTFKNNDALVCADSCPSYCMPNTRSGLHTLLQCKPTTMK